MFYSRNVSVSNRNTSTFRIFIRGRYVAFSSCLRREDQLFFFPQGIRGHAVVMVNDPYDLRLQNRFWILPKKRTSSCVTQEGFNLQGDHAFGRLW